MKRLAIAAAAVAALAALVATLRTEDAVAVDPAETRTITVQGNATVSAAPDEAQLSFGVETRAESAKAALAANGTAMRKVIAAVKAAGGRDLQTQSVWVSSYHGENGPQGYSASNTVAATVDVSKVGTLIDAAVDAGANQVSGPSMSASDRDDVYRQALKNAVADARERAEVLADAAGGSLGRINAVVEGGAAPPPIAMERQYATADSSTPIEPGKQEIAASASVTFTLT